MKKQRAYTLIEVLVVITIIGILLRVSLAALSSPRKISRDNKRKADLEQIRSALEIYRSDILSYPATWDLPGKVPLVGGSTAYMSTVPSDPGIYGYRYSRITVNSYCLCAFLETGGSGTSCACGGNCGTAVCNYFVSNP